MNNLPSQLLDYLATGSAWAAILVFISVVGRDINHTTAVSPRMMQASAYASEEEVNNEVSNTEEDSTSPPLIKREGNPSYLWITPLNREVPSHEYILQVVYEERVLKEFLVVMGTPRTQLLDRSVVGILAPPPDGWYHLSHQTYPSTVPGTGGWFTPKTPLFQTDRGALGIHPDEGSDGTAGCIGTLNEKEYWEIMEIVREYGLTRILIEADPQNF